MLLVTLDALRANHLGCYGYEKPTSPELDAFSREAFVFTDVLAQSGSTVNSLPSLLTSRFPFVDGIREYRPMRLRESETTIAEILRDHGYHTAAVIGWKFADSRFGLGQGFEIFDEDHEAAESADRTVARAIDRLATLREPFFLWIHVRPPHDPYEVPDEAFASFYASDDPGPTLQTSPHAAVLEHWAAREPTESYTVIADEPRPYTPSMIRQLEAMYDANVRQADRAFGRLMDFLETSDLAGRTVVVVGTDHGESVGEHHLFGHNQLYYGIVRVPLLLRLPDRTHAVLSHAAMNVDVFPTILGLLGVPFEIPIRGTDLFQAERGEYFQFAEYENQRTIKRGDLKLIQHRRAIGQERLYDVAADPDETTDLAQSSPDVVSDLLGYSKRLRSLDSREAPLTEESRTLEELRRLGYIY